MRSKQTVRLAPAVARRDRAGLLRTTALQAAFLLVFIAPADMRPAFAQPAPGARPAGGMVVAGGASISQTAAATTVAQSTQRAAIDWRSFDIGASHAVQFQQPGASAVVLNRVTGPDPSQIAGRIQANGQVVITNQSGVVFHQGAQVEAAGLIVSAAGIATPNFMAGRMVFDQAPKPGAAVANAGSITVKETGLAALVAPRVANSGVINARMGRVVLAGAETHTVDLYGDGLLSIDVTGQVRQAPRGPDGKPVTALVTNTGTIVADGGSVTLTAAAADGIVQNLVQAGGTLQANAAGGRSGTIVAAGVGGSVRIEGRASAAGGTVLATATDAVTVAAPARISASGRTGGGTVAIGTRTARSVTVEAGARIAANARQVGDGGRVTVLSGGTTTMDGDIAARGGRSGGNGGAVELSGKTLGLAGRVATAAPAGASGRVLIDPADVTISDHGGPGTVLTPATLQAIDGDVAVAADNSVVVSSSVVLGRPSRSLTLSAGNFVRIDPGVILSADSINLNAGAGGARIGGDLTITGNQRALRLNVAGSVTQDGTSTISANEINGTLGSADLSSPLNRISSIGSLVSGGLTATTGDIRVATNLPLAINGPVASPATVALSSAIGTANAMSLNADIRGGVVALNTDITPPPDPPAPRAPAPAGSPGTDPASYGAIVQNGGTINATALDGNASSAAFGQGNNVAIRSFRTAGDFTFNATGPILLNGTLQSDSGVVRLTTPGAITQGANGILITPTLTGSAGSAALLNAANRVGALQSFTTTTGGLALATTLAPRTGITAADVSNVVGSSTPLLLAGTNSAPAGQTISITADRIAFAPASSVPGATGLLAAPGGTVAFAPLSAARPVELVATAAEQSVNALSLTQANVNAITTGTLRLGSPTAGPILLGQAADALTLAGHAATLNLATAGGVTQGANATLAVGTLNGNVGSLNLPGANQVGTLGAFSAGDALTLNNATDLTVTGPVTAGGVATLSTAGGLALGSNLAAVSIQLAAGPAGVSQTAGAIATPGALTFNTTGGIAQSGTGSIAANGLTGTAGGIVALNGGNNAVANLGPFSSAGSFSLVDGGPVAIVGAVQATGAAPSLSLASPGFTFGSGGSLVARDGTVILAPNIPGNALALSSLAAGASSAVLTGTLQIGNAATGPITIDGPFNLSNTGTLSLVSAGAMSETPAGALTVNTLAANGASLALGGANRIATLGAVSATGDLAVTNAQGLAVAGPVASGTRVQLDVAGDLALLGAMAAPIVTLNATGAITQPSAAITAARLTGTAGAVALGSSANQVASLGPFAAVGDFLVADGRSLAIAGPVISGGNASLNVAGDLAVGSAVFGNNVALNATGGIAQTGGTVSAKLLSVTTSGDATLTGDVAQLSTVRVPGTFDFQDTASVLVVGGPVNVGSFNLAAGVLDIAGALTAGTLQLGVASVGQSGGALQAGVLRGRSGGAMAFGSANGTASIAAIENLSASSLTVNNSVPLLIRGTLRVPQLTLRASSLTLQDGVIGTDSAAFEAAAPGSLRQTGTTTIAPASRPAAQLSMTVHGGLIALDNLVGPSTNLALATNSGRANGTLNVAALNVADQGGGASLQGAVAGRSGFDAAYVATITAFDPAYTLNGCAIAAVSCVPSVVPATVRLVFPSTIRPDIILVESLLRADLFTADLVTLDLARSPSDPDFALPNVSDRDY